jgi:hypothetical protein
MDLRVYYQKIRMIENEISEEFPVLVSRETSDGGKAGVMSQVSRFLAARLIAEEKAILASPEATEAFHAANRDAQRAAQEQIEFLAPPRIQRPAIRPAKKA